MEPQHLTLVEGHSYETICKILEDNQIKFGPDNPRQGKNHFRTSCVLVYGYDNYRRAEELIGEPNTNRPRINYYYGYWQPKQEFNLSQLDGDIRFSKGRLVERVTLRWCDKK